jgi:hypothetical protein
MPNSIGDFLQELVACEWRRHLLRPRTHICRPGKAIRAHVHRAPTVFPRNQLELILQFAAAHGMEIVRAYSDHGRNGLNIAGREVLNRLSVSAFSISRRLRQIPVSLTSSIRLL